MPGVRVALSKHLSGRTGDRRDDRGDGAAVEPADGAEVVAGVAGRSTAIEITLAAD